MKASPKLQHLVWDVLEEKMFHFLKSCRTQGNFTFNKISREHKNNRSIVSSKLLAHTSEFLLVDCALISVPSLLVRAFVSTALLSPSDRQIWHYITVQRGSLHCHCFASFYFLKTEEERFSKRCQVKHLTDSFPPHLDPLSVFSP